LLLLALLATEKWSTVHLKKLRINSYYKSQQKTEYQ